MLCSYRAFKTLSAFQTKTVADFNQAFNDLGLESQVIRNDRTLNHKIMVGKIIKLTPHPTKTQLTVCQVATPDETYQVVCGATNLVLAAKVILALPKAVLFDGTVIKTANFGGIRSNGMLCALSEVLPKQFTQSTTAEIVILPETAPLGNLTPLKYLGFDDVVWKLDLTLGTIQLQNWVGLCHYLAQWWKTPLSDLPITTNYRCLTPAPLTNSLIKSLPTTELVLMLPANSKFKLPQTIQTQLAQLDKLTSNVWTNLATYYRYLAGGRIEFATATATQHYTSLTWSSTAPTNLKAWLLMRVLWDVVTDPYYLPPVFGLTTFSYLTKMLEQQLSQKVISVSNFKLAANPQFEIKLTEIQARLGLTISVDQLKLLFSDHFWKITAASDVMLFTPPLTLAIKSKYQILEEIVRFYQCEKLPPQPLQLTDLPTPKAFDEHVQIGIDLQNCLVSHNLKVARLPFTIKQVGRFYQPPTNLWTAAIELINNYQVPFFTLDTIWSAQSANQLQELPQLLIVAPLNVSVANQQNWKSFNQQIYLQHKLAIICQLLQIPLQGLHFTATTADLTKQPGQTVVTINYQLRQTSYALATIGKLHSTTPAGSESTVIALYLAINYEVLLNLRQQLLTTDIPTSFAILPKTSHFQQDYSYFDTTIAFKQSFQLFYPLQNVESTWQVDYLSYLRCLIREIDKRIVHVEMRDLYQNQRLTFRIYWKVKDPTTKDNVRNKLQRKLEIQLQTLKNVKIY